MTSWPKSAPTLLGNLLIFLIAGALTFGWLMTFSIPYAALLSIMVALFDLVPVVGSSIAGIIVAAAALTISAAAALLLITREVLIPHYRDQMVGRGAEATG